MLFLFLPCIAGGFLALWAGKRFGGIGVLLAFPVGFLGTIVAETAFFGAAIYVQGWCLLGIPWLPPCRNGTCKAGDRFILPGDYEKIPRYDKKQQTEYAKTGRHFYEKLPDGTLKPYLVWRPFKGWHPDKQA
jgi:hypothetical protein